MFRPAGAQGQLWSALCRPTLLGLFQLCPLTPEQPKPSLQCTLTPVKVGRTNSWLQRIQNFIHGKRIPLQCCWLCRALGSRRQPALPSQRRSHHSVLPEWRRAIQRGFGQHKLHTELLFTGLGRSAQQIIYTRARGLHKTHSCSSSVSNTHSSQAQEFWYLNT